jgi:hypothetical protein
MAAWPLGCCCRWLAPPAAALLMAWLVTRVAGAWLELVLGVLVLLEAGVGEAAPGVEGAEESLKGVVGPLGGSDIREGPGPA